RAQPGNQPSDDRGSEDPLTPQRGQPLLVEQVDSAAPGWTATRRPPPSRPREQTPDNCLTPTAKRTRYGMLKLGGGMLEKLLAADPAYCGSRVPCGMAMRRNSPPTGIRSSTRCSARSPSHAPGTTARPASTASPHGMPGSAW